MKTPSLHMGRTEWVMLLLLSCFWGGSFFFFKILSTALPPFTIVLGRVGIAALALNLYLLARGDFMPCSLKLWGSFLVMGILNNVIPFTLIVFGETRIDSGLASILNASTPVFAILSAHMLTQNEKLSWNKGLGVAFGFAGVTLLIGPEALKGLANADLYGELACLLGALTYGFAGIYGRRFKGLAPIKIATGQITASTLFMLPLTALVDRPWTLPMPEPHIWAALLGIALVCTALAYMLFFRILGAAGATNVQLVTFLVPISALILGWLFLGEHLALNALIGMAMIGLGLMCIDGRLLPKRTGQVAGK
jgi:drug/metabolite transporter (DMT)-like permease